jgi:23S rRNA (uracil1939-C5)-methyltransferase
MIKKKINIEQKDILVEGLSHDGRGIAKINNIKTFINGALPSEIVNLKIVKTSRHYYEAEVTEILKSSPQRETPPCLHFNICGGCSLQHMKMTDQIHLKQQTLLDQLKYFGKVEPKTILEPLLGLETGYRRKARLGVKYVIKKNKVLVGFREKGNHYLADLHQCEILHPAIGKKLNDLSVLISSLEIYQFIPQIEIAMGEHDAALIFRHLMPMTSNDKEKLQEFGKHHHLQIFLQPNLPLPIEKIWPLDNNTHLLAYSLLDDQIRLLFHPTDFTQINLDINRRMIKQAINLLDIKNNETVLDLFCGIGNFSLPIALYAKKVIGIEGGIEMVSRAMENASHNKIENVSFYSANLEKPDSNNAWIQMQYDKILLDPPRTGAKAILPFIAKMQAKKIVYVSCNPATLARDAGELVHEYHYELKEVGIMNMFPHTSHIEAMAVFEK